MTPELDVNKIYNTFISFVVDPTIPPEIGLEQILEMFPELVEVLGGDPVNLLTGSFDWEYTDTALYGEYDLEFIRHYQSARAHKNTGLGIMVGAVILTFVATRSLNLIIVMCCGASVPLLWQSMPLFPKARKKW